MHRFAMVTALTALYLLFANSTQLKAQIDSIYRLPAGTRISVKLDTGISSRFSRVNDTFLARVSKPVMVRDAVMIPTGTVIEGRVAISGRPGHAGRSGKLDVVFETLRIYGAEQKIDGVPVTPLKNSDSQRSSVFTIAGGTIAGALLGGLSRGGKGSVIGAAIGAGTGTTIAVLKRGKDVHIDRNTEIDIELRKEVVLPVLDY
jgi:hypothetical protein